MNLEERIQSAQLKHIVKISDKGVDEPLPDPGLFPKSSTITFSKAMKNMEDAPPTKSPLILPAAIGALSGAAHIFQPQATFQPTFGQTSFPTMIEATTMVTATRPQSATTQYTASSRCGGGGSRPSGGGGSGSGGGGRGPARGDGSRAAGGGGTNGGMKGNPPTVFSGDQSKSYDFI